MKKKNDETLNVGVRTCWYDLEAEVKQTLETLGRRGKDWAISDDFERLRIVFFTIEMPAIFNNFNFDFGFDLKI